MELIFKVRNKRLSNDPNFTKGWRDGQLIDIREDGFHDHSNFDKVNHCVIKTQHDFWELRGSTNWKSTAASVYELKKFLVPIDSGGKYPWEVGAKEDEDRIRPRDWFVDFKKLLDLGWITQSDFESIYDVNKKHNLLYLDRDLTSYLVHEDVETRLISIYSDEVNKRFISQNGAGAGTGGGFTIGATGDYTTVSNFEVAIDIDLTGNLDGLHLNEETAISTDVVFDTGTNGNLLRLTAEVGAEHNGGAYGNGARVNMTAQDSISFNETTPGDLADIEVSRLALDISGSANDGILLNACGTSGLATVNRMLIAGGTDSDVGIQIQAECDNSQITNNIIYKAEYVGIRIVSISSGQSHVIANNTAIQCLDNFLQDSSSMQGTLVFKNNLAQADAGGSDYRDDGGTFGTTAKNVSEDATSPDDGIYDNLNCHDGNSCFINYGADDYRLVNTGDEIGTLDDGEDLSGTFTDDIEGKTRSTWYIGASEIVAAGLSINISESFSSSEALD